MSSKEKQIWALQIIFLPCKNDGKQTRHILTKNSKVNPFVIKSVLESNCKRFRKRAIRKNFKPSHYPQTKKLIPTNEAAIFTDTRKQKTTLIPISSFIAEQFLSTSSKTRMRFRIFRSFSSFHQPEKQFRLLQCFFWASAAKASIEIVHIPFSAVRGVEHQQEKKFKNLESWLKCFSEVTQVLFHLLQKNWLQDAKNVKCEFGLQKWSSSTDVGKPQNYLLV